MIAEEIDKLLMNNVFRFAIGPWKGHYSGIWRVWSNENDKEDIYLGASSLLQCLKFSIHQSGVCQLSYTSHNYEILKVEGKAPKDSRHIMRWDRGELSDNEIKQILDIHFPLKTLNESNKPKGKKKKKILVLEPLQDQLGTNDSVTLKLLFHNMNPETAPFKKAVSKRGIMPVVNIELTEGYITLAFCHSKILPIDIPEEHKQSFKNGFAAAAQNMNLKIGEKKDNLSSLLMLESSPPSMICIGGLKISRETEKHFNIDFDTLE